jgi:PAS domain S-box-containing protein
MKEFKNKYNSLLIVLVLVGFPEILLPQQKSDQVIKVGVYDNPPKIFLNAKGQPDGFFIDIVKDIAKKENLQIEFQFNSWNNLYQMLQDGTIDVLPDMVYSRERDTIFSLNKLSVISSWLEIFSRKDLQLQSILDLENLKIGVLKGSNQEKYLANVLSNELNLSYKMYPYDSYSSSVEALKQSKIDVIIADRFFAFSDLFDENMVATGLILRPSELHFGFTKNKNPELVALFDRNLSIQKNDSNSAYYKSLFRWLEKDSKKYIPSYIKWLLLVVFSALLLSSIFLVLLKKRVKNRTAELFKAKEKVGESESQLKLIADNFVKGMLYQVVTVDENKREFKYLSDSVVQLYGCTAAEAMQDPNKIYQKIHPDDIKQLLEEEKKALKNRITFNAECRVINPDGSIRWSYFTSRPRVINDLVCWDGLEVDISERKMMEIELKMAKERAEEADRLKSSFLANMSHEIRTPMNGILGFAELLKEPNLKGKKQQKYIKIIEKSGIRMLNIINDIINISKIESGQMEVNLTKSNINEQLEYIHTFFSPEAIKKKIKLSYEHALPFNEAFISTDREKLFAILTNLVKNAINHTEEGGIVFGYQHKGNFIEFFVRDSGIGIPENRQEAVFERFIQADIANKMALQGAGLGLSISKAYVEILGGSIWLESEEGEGTTFYFTLPYVQEKRSVINSDFSSLLTKKPTHCKKLKIIIADDDVISQKLIAKVIKEYGREIITAKNGLEAVQACRENPDIDLVFMDIQMPIMDGYEAAIEIRKFNKKVIIIAQTAYALSGDMEKDVGSECNDYISKPLNIEGVKHLIFRYFEN